MARKQRGGGGGGGDENRWLATYGDAVTLLMAFFVMLYAISQVDAQKFQLLVSGLQDPFKNKSAEQGLLDSGNGIVGAEFKDPQVSKTYDAVELLPNPAELVKTNNTPEQSQDPGGVKYIQSAEELAQVRDSLVEALTGFGLDPNVSLRLDSRGLVVSIATDDVLFASGSPALQPSGREIITALAPILEDFDNEILIEGHTDTVPLNQNGYTNWNLSADRAIAVLDLLQASGINPTRLSATGYGEYRPISDNSTETGRSANRRVELVIVAAPPAATTDTTAAN
jgi:chemotaxis protein MotB